MDWMDWTCGNFQYQDAVDILRLDMAVIQICINSLQSENVCSCLFVEALGYACILFSNENFPSFKKKISY